MDWFRFNAGDFTVCFLSLLFEGIPFVFIGSLLGGFVDTFLPAQAIEHLLPKNRILAVAAGASLGIILPMCECGIIPMIRRLMGKGMPISSALAYLLAAPIVNPVVAVSTFAAFRGQHPLEVTMLRLGLGFVVATIIGLLTELLSPTLVLNRSMLTQLKNWRRSANVPVPIEHSHKHVTFLEKVLAAFRCAGSDFLAVAFYLVIGAAVTSIFNTAVNQTIVVPVASHIYFAVPSMMALAFLLSLCSTSDAFIAANFAVMPLMAKLSFMVFGPMMDLKLVFMYSLVFRKSFTVLVGLSLLFLIGLSCGVASFIQ